MSIAARRFQRGSVAGKFYEFSPGTVKPLSYLDEAQGAGSRNVGPRTNNLTSYNGDYTLTAGAQVSGLEIFGRLIGRGDSSTRVTDCIVHGSSTIATSASAAALGTSYNFGGAVFEWCRFDLSGNEGAFTDVIDGGNYTMRYCEVLRGVDGIGANVNGNVEVYCCRIASGYYMSWWNDVAAAPRTTSFVDADGGTHSPPFPSQSSGDTHSDGIQIQQASGWVVRGCYVGGNRVGGWSGAVTSVATAWRRLTFRSLTRQYRLTGTTLSKLARVLNMPMPQYWFRPRPGATPSVRYLNTIGSTVAVPGST